LVRVHKHTTYSHTRVHRRTHTHTHAFTHARYWHAKYRAGRLATDLSSVPIALQCATRGAAVHAHAHSRQRGECARSRSVCMHEWAGQGDGIGRRVGSSAASCASAGFIRARTSAYGNWVCHKLALQPGWCLSTTNWKIVCAGICMCLGLAGAHGHPCRHTNLPCGVCCEHASCAHTQASMAQLLRSCLARNAKEASVAAAPLAPARDTSRLRKHISLVRMHVRVLVFMRACVCLCVLVRRWLQVLAGA